MGFFQNACKPTGLGGKMMVRMMNNGHSKMARWAFSHMDTKPIYNVLDIGCGGGANVATWLSKCNHVTGVDYSTVSVEATRKLNQKEVNEGRCQVLQGNVAQLPFEDNSFNRVSAFETIYFWPTLEKSFAQVYRVLQPEGKFLICNECSGMSSADAKWEKMIEGMRVYMKEQLYEILMKVGFKNIKINENQEKKWLCIIAQK